jgi:hypothetical protein
LDKLSKIVKLINQSGLYGVYTGESFNFNNIFLNRDETDEVKTFLKSASQIISVENDDKLLDSIIYRTLSFCCLVGFKYLTVQEMMPLIKIVSLVYLLDESTDSSGTPRIYLPEIEEIVSNESSEISKIVNEQIDLFLKEDRELVRKLAFKDVSLQEYYMRMASLIYFKSKNEMFIRANRQDIIKAMASNVGLEMVAMGLYMLLRKKGVSKKSSAEIPARFQKLIKILNGFIRAADDFGDLKNDKGNNINIFGSEFEIVWKEFIVFCGIDINLYSKISAEDLLKLFYAKSLEEIESLGALSADEEVFLNLLLRVMEGGFVNIIGDQFFSGEEISQRTLKLLKDFNYKI